MNRYLPSFMAIFSCVALLAIGVMSLPEPAQAQFGLFIQRFGPIPFGGGGGYGGRRYHGGGGGGSSDSDDNNSRQDRNDRPVSLAPPPSKEQNFLLHEVALLNPDELGLASADGGEAHSAEAVRHHIKQLIDAEDPSAILSDDTIVERLRESGIDIARRTVAKYREAMRIPSSVQRRRDKQSSLLLPT